MRVEYIAKIEVPTKTLKEGTQDQYQVEIGTAYPIREGLVLTARHVVFPKDRDKEKPIRVIWKHEDEDKLSHVAKVSKIEFESEKFDIAVLACDTGKLALPPMILADAGQFPESSSRWKSYGYPTAGKKRGIRIKNPACGSFYPADQNYYVQWLSSEGDVGDKRSWQGMSGAPVFDDNNRLMAVIIQTSSEYKERLRATSIPYLLLPDKCDGFRELVSNKRLAEEQLPAAKLADDFEQWLIYKLADELSFLQNKTLVLHEQLIKELDLNNTLEASHAKANTHIAETLLKDDDFEEVVDSLAAATSDCLLEKGRKYSSQLPLEQIRSTAENILAWLVLRAIDEEQLQTILPICSHRSSLFFSLKSIQSLAGIEIAMARRFNRKPSLNGQYDSEHESHYRINIPKELFKWDGEESVQRVFIEIWNRVFHASRKKELHEQYTSSDLKYLNKQLAKRRTHRRFPEHFYLSFTEEDYEGCVDFVSGIYQDLLSKLHEMTVIEYGSKDQQSLLFVMPEEDIRTAIVLFYDEIDGKLGNKR